MCSLYVSTIANIYYYLRDIFCYVKGLEREGRGFLQKSIMNLATNRHINARNYTRGRLICNKKNHKSQNNYIYNLELINNVTQQNKIQS